jgi:mersacidin/lichenicidin family type 2 lantibiotic
MMISKSSIIRAWKDPEYRHGLNEAEKRLLPDHPAGLIEFTEADLAKVSGGSWGVCGYDENGIWHGDISGGFQTVCREDDDRQMSVCRTYRVGHASLTPG